MSHKVKDGGGGEEEGGTFAAFFSFASTLLSCISKRLTVVTIKQRLKGLHLPTECLLRGTTEGSCGLRRKAATAATHSSFGPDRGTARMLHAASATHIISDM